MNLILLFMVLLTNFVSCELKKHKLVRKVDI